MSALIKSNGGRTGDPVLAWSRACSPVALVPEPHEAECIALREEVAQLGAALVAAKADRERAVEQARGEGREAGLAEAVRDDAERHVLLSDGIEAAARSLSERLDNLEQLAPLLASAALEKLFGADAPWAAMVEATLVRQLGALRRSSVTAVRVSAWDFAAEPLAGLCVRLGDPALDLSTDPDLAAGECRIECRLGEIDLSVPGQWQTLAALLDRMVAG
jgi:flagellar biosynthesis/type III secretory pathway protein FliH